jgi:hypothetical protein
MLNFLQFFRQHWKRILFRVHKDKRSLAAFLMLLGIVAYCTYYGFLLFKNPLSFVMLCLGAMAAWRLRKSHEKDDEALIRLTNYAPITIKPSETALASLRVEMMKLWLLLWRASSEHFLNEKFLPDGTEVLTRRCVLDKLDELGLREELNDKELQLHLTPDGEWSKESILENRIRAAELEALQYCCGAIIALSPIEDFYRIVPIDTANISSVTKETAWRPRETFDIRQEREMAAVFYLRCFGEQVNRGLVEKPVSEERG